MNERYKPSREAMRTLPHLTREANPLGNDYHPYHISVQRPESHNFFSMKHDKIIEKQPAGRVEVIVWAKGIPDIGRTLRYHYGISWNDVRLIQSHEPTRERDERE